MITETAEQPIINCFPECDTRHYVPTRPGVMEIASRHAGSRYGDRGLSHARIGAVTQTLTYRPAPGPHAGDPWAGLDNVRAVDVTRVAGIEREEIRTVVRAGLITPVQIDGGARHGAAVRFTRDDALFLLYAARMARSIGQALVSIMRVLVAAGARLAEGGGFVLPPPPVFPGPNTP